MPSREEERELDHVLRHIGFGWWSVSTIAPYAFIGLYTPMIAMGGAFLNARVGHHCHVSALDNISWTLEQRLNYSIPWEERDGNLVRSQCLVYDRDYSNMSQVTENEGTSNIHEISHLPEVPCSSWEYDTSTFSSTFSSEWDLVCDRMGLSVLFQSLYFFGAFLTQPLTGFITDRYGRRAMIRVTTAVYTIVTLLASFATHYVFVLAARFIQGTMEFGNLAAYVMAVESSAPQHRTLTGMSLFAFYALGEMLFGGLAYLVREWRDLMKIISAIGFLSFIPALIMDESPRWLIRIGRLPEALTVLRKAARWHNVKIEEDDLQTIATLDLRESSAQKHTSNYNLFTDVLKILKSPIARGIALAMFACWFFIGVLFWGISMSGGNWSSNPFLYMTVSALMEGIGYVGFTPCVGHYGRKPIQIIAFSISAIVILSLLFIPTEFNWLIVTMAMIGKLCSSCIFNTVFLSTSEVFPTTFRSSCINLCCTMSRLGGLVTPAIVEALVTKWSWGPQAVFGCCALMGIFVTLKIPETNKMPLPETLKDMESLYGKRRRDTNEDLSQDLTLRIA